MEGTERNEDRCTWLVHGTPRWVEEAYAEVEDFEWYPDSPSDLVSECGAPIVRTDRGWECEAGHSHFHDAEYFDDDEVAGMAARGIALPANALGMDGRTL
jgi:hypothetical protein